MQQALCMEDVTGRVRTRDPKSASENETVPDRLAAKYPVLPSRLEEPSQPRGTDKATPLPGTEYWLP